MATTIPLKQWIQGALECSQPDDDDDDDNNNNISTVALSPAYLTNALRIALALTQQISDVEESSTSQSSCCDDVVTCLPPPFPVACIDWADCITVRCCCSSSKEPNDEKHFGHDESLTNAPTTSSSPRNSPSSLLASSLQSDRWDDDALDELLGNIAREIEGETVPLPENTATVTTMDAPPLPRRGINGGYFLHVENARLFYIPSEDSHPVDSSPSLSSSSEKLQRIYSLGLVFYELFSGGDLPPLDLLVVSSRNGEDLAILSLGRAVEGEGKEEERSSVRPLDHFASMLNMSDDTHANMEPYDSQHVYNTSYRSKKRQSFSSRSRQTTGVVSSRSSLDSLCMKGVPIRLCDLICNMIDCINGGLMGNESYSKMVDVTYDLQLMLDKPFVYLHDLDVDRLSLHGLELDDTLFERNNEFECLQCAYRRSLSGSPELGIITGVSGTGKSTMAHQLGHFITSSGGVFLSGKFDQMMRRVQPLSAVASAFDNYCDVLTREEETERAMLVASQLRTALGSDLYYLIQVIPNLSQIIRTSAIDIPPNQDDCVDAQQRLQYLFCQFVEVISSCSSGPIALFMDDVQWADSASISVIGHILKTSRYRQDGNRVFFLATCRDDEMESDHSFWKMVESVGTFGFNTSVVKLECMDQDTVTRVISNLLHLSPRLVRSLSDIVYHKTKGNPLFVSKLLLSLNREGLLNISLVRHRWEWDVEKIQSRKLPDDVAMFFVRSINTLPVDVKISLSALSCLGASAECEVIYAIETNLNLNLIEPLNVAVAEGLLNKVDGRYCFCHDRVHEATYGIIEEQDRCLHHMNYGLSLIDVFFTTDNASLLLTAATQINLAGPSAVQDAEKYHQIANYNLMAGKKAMEMSDFSSAFSFFDHGMTFLRKKRWQDHYDLSLELFNLAAKCALTIKDLTSLTVICDEVLINARNSDDTLNVSFILMSALTHSMVSESVEFGFHVLSNELGVDIHSSTSREDTLNLITQTQSTLNGFTEETLLSYQVLTNYNMVMALKFLAKLESSIQQVNPALVPFVTIKIVELTIEHGVSPMSAIGFAYFGGMIAELGDLRGGYRYTKLAKALLHKHPSNEIAGEVILKSTEILSFIEPLQTTNDHRLQGQVAAMAAGDVHWACMNKLLFTCTLLWSGENLSEVKEAFIKAGHFSEEHSHQISFYYLKIFDRTISRLVDGEDLTMSDDQLTRHAIETKNPYQLVIVYFHNLFHSLVFNNYEEMKLSAENFLKFTTPSWNLLSGHSVHTLIGGLASFRIYRETNDLMWAQRGNQFKERMKTWNDQGSLWNFENKSFLLDAEYSYSNGDLELARVAYEKAISSARRHKFIHEEAIAYELAANFYLNTGNKSIALKYFTDAHGKYFEWGAFAKVKALYAYIQETFRCDSPSAVPTL
eukprot:CCRYP_014514-RA/>CCRYP_014514-RA protein AED:0.02 eAED:0.01 QI:0/1/0.8/1/1/1/5/397/1398